MRLLAILLGAVCAITSVSADDSAPAKTPMMQSFNDLKWTALPERPGMQIAALTGDPTSGPYTQIRKVPAGTRNPLHSHSSDITNVIISGTWYTGTDEASARDFGPGSVIFMPGNWLHVSGCRSGSECVFYQDGKGKFDFKPASAQSTDPSDAVEKEIRQLERAETDGMLKRDVPALERIWAEDFTVNNPRNTISRGRNEVVALIRNGSIEYSSFVRDIEAVLRHGETVIVMGSETVTPIGKAPLAGQTVRRRFTHFWMKRDAEWRLTARHANVICNE